MTGSSPAGAVGAAAGCETSDEGTGAAATDGGTDEVTTDDPSGDAETVGAVLLAAGESTRFEGGNKLLARIDGMPVVRRAAETLLATSLAGPVAVLGHGADAVAGALEGLGVATRRNEAYAAGQHTSVAAGVAAARERDWDAVVFALGDMPAVDPGTVERIVAAYRAGRGNAIAPTYEGKRGNPALFDGRHYDALASVTGDRGGRAILEAEGTLLAVDDPGVLRDVDRRADLEGLDPE